MQDLLLMTKISSTSTVDDIDLEHVDTFDVVNGARLQSRCVFPNNYKSDSGATKNSSCACLCLRACLNKINTWELC